MEISIVGGGAAIAAGPNRVSERAWTLGGKLGSTGWERVELRGEDSADSPGSTGAKTDRGKGGSNPKEGTGGNPLMGWTFGLSMGGWVSLGEGSLSMDCGPRVID